MDKDKVLEYVISGMDGAKQEEQILMAIEDAVEQIRLARDFFDYVSEPKLIDYAIYLEEAAKARYEFLISEAKRLNIKTQHDRLLMEPRVV
ncbi:MAG: YaaL family protein [Bacillota bacterium]|nr:YaaL family protein [Bacillota bacterium]